MFILGQGLGVKGGGGGGGVTQVLINDRRLIMKAFLRFRLIVSWQAFIYLSRQIKDLGNLEFNL